jgi:hypothetical protein
MSSSLAPREVRHRRSHLGWQHSRTCSGSTLARMHPEIRCTNRSHLTVMHALGVSPLLMCPRDPLSRHHSRSHVTVMRTSRGRCRVHLRETLPRSCPQDPPPRPLPHRRRAHLMPRTGLRDPPLRACPSDPPSRACPPDPPSLT